MSVLSEIFLRVPLRLDCPLTGRWINARAQTATAEILHLSHPDYERRRLEGKVLVTAFNCQLLVSAPAAVFPNPNGAHSCHLLGEAAAIRLGVDLEVFPTDPPAIWPKKNPFENAVLYAAGPRALAILTPDPKPLAPHKPYAIEIASPHKPIAVSGQILAIHPFRGQKLVIATVEPTDRLQAAAWTFLAERCGEELRRQRLKTTPANETEDASTQIQSPRRSRTSNFNKA